jgi:hypothetical protein
LTRQTVTNTIKNATGKSGRASVINCNFDYETKFNLVKKTSIIFLLSILLALPALAQIQKIAQADLKKLRQKEDSLKEFSQYLNTDEFPEDRMYSDSIFTKTLIRALLVKNSFYYPFDSVIGISKLYAPDTSFRIITWTILYGPDYIMYSQQRGAIQMRTADGSLKLYPLRDVSEFYENPQDSIRSRMNWIGAVYYNMIKTQNKGKNYYTLFGFDPNSAQSSKKWIEVLSFNEKSEPVFGGQMFTYEMDSIPKPPLNRYSTEYKKGTRVLVDFVPDLDMILVDHLISESDQPELKWTLVPDGDQEGYKWVNGKWQHIDKVFTFKLQDGQAPVGDPLMDIRGNKNEQKLMDKTNTNKTKEVNKEKDDREN